MVRWLEVFLHNIVATRKPLILLLPILANYQMNNHHRFLSTTNVDAARVYQDTSPMIGCVTRFFQYTDHWDKGSVVMDPWKMLEGSMYCVALCFPHTIVYHRHHHRIETAIWGRPSHYRICIYHQGPEKICTMQQRHHSTATRSWSSRHLYSRCC